jgi:hypothetical protein
MKYGIEVEGAYKGLKMIFCDAASKDFPGRVLEEAGKRKVDGIYISDNTNAITNFTLVGDYFKNYMVTLDVTEVKDSRRASNVNVMLRIDGDISTFDSVNKLVIGVDQLKFERDKHVVVVPFNPVFTLPEDFIGDIEI